MINILLSPCSSCIRSGQNSTYETGLTTVYVWCLDAVRQIFREEGFRGLWSGTRASLVLATNPAIQFTVYETVKRYMRGANKEV